MKPNVLLLTCASDEEAYEQFVLLSLLISKTASGVNEWIKEGLVL